MPARRIRAVPGEEWWWALMSRVPSGVAVVTVDTNGGNDSASPVSSLVVLSLEPPLVAIALSRQAAMHELLREADGFAISILTEGQERLAQHFARGVPPIAMWEGIAVEAGDSGAPLLTGALGWLECRLHNELQVGTHTLFVGEVVRVQLGKDAPPLQRSHGEYTPGDRSPSSSTSTACSSTSDPRAFNHYGQRAGAALVALRAPRQTIARTIAHPRNEDDQAERREGRTPQRPRSPRFSPRASE